MRLAAVNIWITFGRPPRSFDAHYQLRVEQVTAAYLPDPRGGAARWLHCGGTTYAARPIRIGYRVTVVSTPAPRAEAAE